jgi:hypothetical protein
VPAGCAPGGIFSNESCTPGSVVQHGDLCVTGGNVQAICSTGGAATQGLPGFEWGDDDWLS